MKQGLNRRTVKNSTCQEKFELKTAAHARRDLQLLTHLAKGTLANDRQGLKIVL
jgi:hypothetical protein